MDVAIPNSFHAFEAGGEDFAIPEDRVRRAGVLADDRALSARGVEAADHG
jgi:hypothetical protein